VTLGDADFRKVPYEDVYGKVLKNSVTTCHEFDGAALLLSKWMATLTDSFLVL